MSTLHPDITSYFAQLQLPKSASHKGQNGKLLIIGGSDLFHAASKWSLDIASKCVDMVFYSSVPSNNELVKEAKGEFWNGIVVEREHIESYLEEADCILIGPGMTRSEETTEITNSLLKKFSEKKWVIDAGAVQMVDVALLNENTIITPHFQELKWILETFDAQVSGGQSQRLPLPADAPRDVAPYLSQLQLLVKQGVTVLLKGPTDLVFHQDQVIQVAGGNAGMTKGGTGDVLAGLVAALYCKHEAVTAAVVASYVNKKAGEKLAEKVGPFFNASDLVTVIPEVLWHEYQARQAQ
jgi:hydroxyethylthiazole kinase-like uncharacterized protein yjeF